MLVLLLLVVVTRLVELRLQTLPVSLGLVPRVPRLVELKVQLFALLPLALEL